jgi:spore coat protein U-like protein
MANRWTPGLVALAALPAALVGQTYTATSGMPVRMEVAASCAVAASDLDFGAYNAGSALPVLGQSSLQLQCTPGLVAELTLDSGAAPGADTNRRQMLRVASGDRLDYGLYQDAARSVHWGDTPGVDTVEVPTTGALQAVPVYGRIPPGQNPQAGVYADEVTVRVLF